MPASKKTKAGNKRKRPARTNEGRPLLFKSAKELDEKIEEYFAWADNRVRDVYIKEAGANVPISDPAPYTVSGLAVFLGTNRQTLVNYSERDEFFDSIKRARARCEADLEERAIMSRQPAGSIFVLKNNFKWVDESKQTLEGNLTTRTELSPEAQAVLAKASRSGSGEVAE